MESDLGPDRGSRLAAVSCRWVTSETRLLLGI
jgi:hypothetical protein